MKYDFVFFVIKNQGYFERAGESKKENRTIFCAQINVKFQPKINFRYRFFSAHGRAYDDVT